MFINNTIDKYSIIYAAPPWQYRTSYEKKPRGPELHYPTMHTADICALPVKDIAAENSILFMWATFSKIPDALEVNRGLSCAKAINENRSSRVTTPIPPNVQCRYEYSIWCRQPDLNRHEITPERF